MWINELVETQDTLWGFGEKSFLQTQRSFQPEESDLLLTPEPPFPMSTLSTLSTLRCYL